MRNRARPEGSIAEAYVADECLTFCSRYMYDVETRFNQDGRNIDSSLDHTSSCGLSVFMHGANLLGSSTIAYVERDYDKMVWYVLNNCAEVEPHMKYVLASTLVILIVSYVTCYLHVMYVLILVCSLFIQELLQEGCNALARRIEKGFAIWFKHHVSFQNF